MFDPIRLVGMTVPVIKRVLKDFRNEDDPSGVVDITGYTIRLIVKNSLDLADSRVHFTLDAAIVTAAAGIYSFTFTTKHSSLAPGIYPAEIRWWSGSPTNNPALDAVQINFEVLEPVDNTV